MNKLSMLDISWILLIIEAFGSMTFGVVFAVLGTPPFILEYIGMDWSTIVTFSPLLANSLMLAQRLLGFAHISIALASLLILKQHYRQGQRWALLFIFIIKLPVWPPGILLIPPAIPIAFWGTITLSAMWILGLIIGVMTLKRRQLD